MFLPKLVEFRELTQSQRLRVGAERVDVARGMHGDCADRLRIFEARDGHELRLATTLLAALLQI